jgi:hypothetical protein
MRDFRILSYIAREDRKKKLNFRVWRLCQVPFGTLSVGKRDDNALTRGDGPSSAARRLRVTQEPAFRMRLARSTPSLSLRIALDSPDRSMRLSESLR